MCRRLVFNTRGSYLILELAKNLKGDLFMMCFEIVYLLNTLLGKNM